MTEAKLVLEDGLEFDGKLFGTQQRGFGEVIFNTSMTGYQEIITDPAYYGQIVLLTNPSIGNYGTNRHDYETIEPFINGLIVKEINEHPANFRSEESLNTFLKQHQLTCLAGIDTRQLVRHLRTHGSMHGAILLAKDFNRLDEAVERMKKSQQLIDLDQLSTTAPYVVPGHGKRIVVIDLGMKDELLYELTKRNSHIIVVPYNYTAEQINRLKPDGLIVSSGPSHPKEREDTKRTLGAFIGKIPVFAIGLGHHLLALACGATVEKLKIGHHGTTYPVKRLEDQKTVMTSQNNCYTVCPESLKNTPLKVTYENLQDHTIAGLQHEEHIAFSVQFYPEGSPGPKDAVELFDHFLSVV